MSGVQGQTPHVLIIFGEGEVVNMAKMASGAHISGGMGTQHQGFTKPISTSGKVVQRSTFCQLVMHSRHLL